MGRSKRAREGAEACAGGAGDHEEGSKLILQFLKVPTTYQPSLCLTDKSQDFSSLPFDSLAPSEVRTPSSRPAGPDKLQACLKVRQMRDEMASKGNQFVQSLLQQTAS
eukprot:86072-Hanusia_phi.AAC.1